MQKKRRDSVKKSPDADKKELQQRREKKCKKAKTL